MVLESLFPGKEIINKPLDMLILSVVVSLAAIFLSQLIFPGPSTGRVIVLFTTIIMAPIIYRIFSYEEEIEREQAEGKIKETFLERHGETIFLFSLFFIGNFLALFFFSLIAPEDFVKSVFDDQLAEIARISTLSGAILSSALTPNILEVIIINNLRVMILAFLLSFLIGTGSIIILSWNASILALYLASFVRDGLLEEFLIRTLSIIPHAPIEILAYFLAGIGGGILSVGIIREQLRSKEFVLVFRDSLLMMGLAVSAVVLGAYVEVFL